MDIISICQQKIKIEPIEARWYNIPHEVDFDFYTKSGRKHIHLDKDFMFDGRSGGLGADLVAPNLGTQNEIKAWLCHDILFYDTSGFSFNEANLLLYKDLRNKCKYNWLRAKSVYWAVQLFGRGSFCEPAPIDREFPNLGKIHVQHFDK